MKTAAAVSPAVTFTVVRVPPRGMLLDISPGLQRHEALRWRLMGAMLAAGMQPVDVQIQHNYADARFYDGDRHMVDLTFRCPCRGEQIRERWPIRPARTPEETDDRIVLDVVAGLAEHIRDDIKKGLI